MIPDGVRISDLRSLVGAHSKVVLEIGANDGTDSMRLAKAFRSAVVHCFEPEPRVLAELRLKAARSRQLVVHPTAVCAIDSPVDFYQSSGAPEGREAEFLNGWHLSGSIRPPLDHLEIHPWCTFDSVIRVEGCRLDTWAAEHQLESVDLIWADVQGAEVDLIEGGRQTLESTRFFYTEFDDRELYEGQLGLPELRKLLPNWEVAERYRHNVLLRNTNFR